MKEAELAQLVDALRGLSGDEPGDDEHLQAALRGFGLVRSAMAEEAPPAAQLAIARALGSQRRRSGGHPLHLQVLRPVLDGVAALKPAGSRARDDSLAEASSTETLLEADCEPHGPLSVELRIDRSSDSNRRWWLERFLREVMTMPRRYQTLRSGRQSTMSRPSTAPLVSLASSTCRCQRATQRLFGSRSTKDACSATNWIDNAGSAVDTIVWSRTEDRTQRLALYRG